ncbi:MAG: hypothetical protein C9356_12115 [Oleiphilus sp.]|nr:MAG: hypothetical protein C9356_12115 [Oleiphilus sp.]
MQSESNYGLQRIILIDSFLPGRRYFINLDGNIGITGENGAGKTSAIKLPVIFYGERPQKIGIKANVELALKGFSGWYLPRNGSYVVFEYLSDGEKRCVAFLPDSSTEEGMTRLFIECGYEDALFFDELIERPCSRDQFMRNLAVRNIRHYTPNSFDQYRKVLLDGDVKGQRHFSMVPPSAKLSQLHEVFGGMLKRETDFSMLCKIIENWAHNGIGDDSKRALSSFSLDRTKLKGWLAEYNAHKKLLSKATPEVLKKANNAFEEFRHNSAKIDEIVTRAKSWKERLVLDLQALRENFEKEQLALQTKLEDNNDQIEEVTGQVSQIENEVNQLDSEIVRLLSMKDSYEKKIGDDYQSKLNNLETARQQLTFLRKQREMLEGEVLKLEEWYKDQQREIEKRFSADKNTYNTQISQLKSDKKDDDHARQMAHQKSLSELADRHRQAKDQLNKKLEALTLEIVTLKAAVNHPETPSNLQERLSELTAVRESLLEKERALIEDKNACLNELSTHREEYSTLDKSMNRLDQEIEDLQGEMESVQAKLNANEKSLLNFVRRHVPDWESTIGKIVRKDVLLKNNLNPILDDPASDTVFGVRISTESLPAAENFDDQHLKRELDKLLARLSQLEQQWKQVEKDQTLAYSKVEAKEKALKKIEQQLTELRPKLRDSKSQLGRLENEIAQWKEHFRAQTQAQIDEIEASQETVREELAELEASHTAASSALSQTLSEEQHKADTKFNNAHAALQKDLEELGAKEQQAKDALERTHATKLKEKDVDPAHLKQLDSEIGSTEETIRGLLELQQMVEIYQSFMSNDYSRLDALQSEVTQLRARLESTSAKKASLVTLRDQLVHQKGTMKTAWTDQNAKLNNDIVVLKGMIKESQYKTVGDIESVMVSVDMVTDTYQLKELFDESIRERDKAEEALHELLVPIKRVFTEDSNQGTSLHQYYSNNPTNTASSVGLAKLIFNYFDNELQKNDIRILRNNLNELDKLNNYVAYISSFANRIDDFSRRLNQQMMQVSSFESLENLRAETYFSLLDEDSWKDMKALSDSYKAWRDMESGSYELGEMKAELPSLELFNAIQDYVENATTQELSTDELAQFIDFKISFEDKGQPRHVKSHKLLKHASSNARSYLILVVIFVGFVNMVRGERMTPLVWAVDELRDISVKNIEKLIGLLGANNISLISACPDVDEHIFDIFDRVYDFYELDDGTTVLAENLPETIDEELALELGA